MKKSHRVNSLILQLGKNRRYEVCMSIIMCPQMKNNHY